MVGPYSFEVPLRAADFVAMVMIRGLQAGAATRTPSMFRLLVEGLGIVGFTLPPKNAPPSGPLLDATSETRRAIAVHLGGLGGGWR